MLMKAGKLFYHEKKITGPLEGLQIFIQPKQKDLKPEVVFPDFPETGGINVLRLLASRTAETPL